VTTFNFIPVSETPATAALRASVRAFLDDELVNLTPVQRAHSWTAFDAQFSRRLGDRGWIGMTWPECYGGGARSDLERYVVLEELLAAGAPVAAHWIADRQSGALLLRHASEAQRQRYLPLIARGELYFCIGMSEPGAGSDLAAINTRARRVDGGWVIDGAKLWTTHAQRAHLMIALVRTSPPSADRHAGLSQFLIDLSAPGIAINPIADQTGAEHFAEVFFDQVRVGDDMLLGTEGEGWQQVNAELTLERSGPERYLSSFRLLEELLAAQPPTPSPPMLDLIGTAVAEVWTLRQMSRAVAGGLADGANPALEAVIVKDLGNCFEQDLPRRVQAAIGDDLDPDRAAALTEVTDFLLRLSPCFSLRGGTREILRGIIARELGLR
jgi:alkylation response protein AidB-like acyl-CoA dehydrogenase